MDEIRITLESLYDTLRNEKKKADLQKLPKNFFSDVVNYLRDKKMLLESQNGSSDLFAANERDKLEYELRSIKRILKEIYEKREKKIISIALNKSRTRSDLIDNSSMLVEEKEFYQKILQHFDVYRMGILFKMFQGQLPLIEVTKDAPSIIPPPKPKDPFSRFEGTDEIGPITSQSNLGPAPLVSTNQVKLETQKPSSPDLPPVSSVNPPEQKEDVSISAEIINADASNLSEASAVDETVQPVPQTSTIQPNVEQANSNIEQSNSTVEQAQPNIEQQHSTVEQIQSNPSQSSVEQSEETEQKSSLAMTAIKFIRAVPRFIWKDMKEYGPFSPGESTNIFPEVAELLVRKGRAEKL